MKKPNKSTFALFFGNRGFFPGSLIASARKEMKATLKKLGHKTLMMDAIEMGCVGEGIRPDDGSRTSPEERY